jgi:ferredoxin
MSVVVCAGGRCGDPLSLDGAVLDRAGISTVVIDDLCTDADALDRWRGDPPNGGAPTVVVGHRDTLDMVSVQTALRRCDIEPLAVDIIRVDGDGQVDAVAVAAQHQRCEQRPPIMVDHVRLRIPEKLSRRDVFRPPQPHAVAAPAAVHEACVADRGCRACIETCPTGALRLDDTGVVNDRTACVSCGTCVTACPTGAMVNPTVTPVAIAAAVRFIVATDPGCGVAFVCHEAAVAPRAGWHQVSVPCTGMLTPGWLLSAVAQGAAAVVAVPCEDADCPLGRGGRLKDCVRRTQQTLASLGADPDLVGLSLGEIRTVGLPAADSDGFYGPKSEAIAVMSLADALGATAQTEIVGHDLRMVELDPATCTACEACVLVCPTAALRSQVPSDGGVVIDLDPTDCVGCERCLSSCPEKSRGAISFTPRVSVGELVRGRRTVRTEQVARCDLCGGPVAPLEMLERIREAIPDEEALLDLVSRRCLDCR